MTTTPLHRRQTPTVQLVTEAVIAAYIQDLAASARALTPHARRADRPTPTSLARRTPRRNVGCVIAPAGPQNRIPHRARAQATAGGPKRRQMALAR
jgi:hypothetical protein